MKNIKNILLFLSLTVIPAGCAGAIPAAAGTTLEFGFGMRHAYPSFYYNPCGYSPYSYECLNAPYVYVVPNHRYRGPYKFYDLRSYEHHREWNNSDRMHFHHR